MEILTPSGERQVTFVESNGVWSWFTDEIGAQNFQNLQQAVDHYRKVDAASV